MNSPLDLTLDLATEIKRHQDQILAHLNWFALIDPAQHTALPKSLKPYAVSRCLLSYDEDTPVAKVAPHLLQLSDINTPAIKWIAKHSPISPCATLIATELDFENLFGHLSQFLDVQFDDGDLMFLAFWDPAILAALVGQADDLSLHVAGPILKPDQAAALLAPISAWWYYDRDGHLHEIKAHQTPSTLAPKVLSLPLQFNHAQTDLMVEASVPDHLLSHLQINAPSVMLEHSPETRYAFIKPQLARARSYGLLGTGDLLNYVGLAFMWGGNFNERADIAPLLAQVKQEKMCFNDAMAAMPNELDAVAK